MESEQRHRSVLFRFWEMEGDAFIPLIYPTHLSHSFIPLIYPTHLSHSSIPLIYPTHLSHSFIAFIYPILVLYPYPIHLFHSSPEILPKIVNLYKQDSET